MIAQIIVSFSATLTISFKYLVLFSCYDSCLQVFQARTKQFLNSYQINSLISFQELNDNLINSWSFFSFDEPSDIIVEKLRSSSEIKKKSFAIFQDKELDFDSKFDLFSETFNDPVLFFLECLSFRSILVFTYQKMTNFTFFNIYLFRLIFSIDLYLFIYLHLLIDFFNAGLTF